MKKTFFITTVCIGLLGAGSFASAEVTSLSARFGGGCVKSNTGSCTVKATAQGSDLESSTVVLQTSKDGNGNWKNVSNNARSLDSNGNVSFRIRNVAACFRVATAENGNDTTDHHSRAICE